jgi:hypothetical protein
MTDPPRLPHDDPELEPLAHGSTPEEKEERWAELARRLGSALAHREYTFQRTLPEIQQTLAEHGMRLDEHERQLELLHAEREVKELHGEIKRMHQRLIAIEKRLPPELKQ